MSLRLSKRVKNTLHAAGYYKLKKLAPLSLSQLIAIPGLGIHAVKSIIACLEFHEFRAAPGQYDWSIVVPSQRPGHVPRPYYVPCENPQPPPPGHASDLALAVGRSMLRAEIGNADEGVLSVFNDAAKLEAVPRCTCEDQDDEAHADLYCALIGVYSRHLPSLGVVGVRINAYGRLVYEDHEEAASRSEYKQYIT